MKKAFVFLCALAVLNLKQIIAMEVTDVSIDQYDAMFTQIVSLEAPPSDSQDDIEESPTTSTE